MVSKIVKFEKGRKYDRLFEHYVINEQIGREIKANRDYIMLCVGGTGSGKSNLSLHAMDVSLKEESDIRFVALNRNDLASAYKYASEKRGHRFVCFDEADVSSREAMTKFNRELLSLVGSIRGLNIVQWWNNPSIEWFDKPFIQEYVKGVIFVTDFTVCDVARSYYFFTRTGILKMLEDQGNLKIETLKKYGFKYCTYVGWFMRYDGELYKEYLEKKQSRMESKIDTFMENWGDKAVLDYTQHDVMDRIGIKKVTWYKYFKEIEKRGVLGKVQRATDGIRLSKDQVELCISEYNKILEEKIALKKQRGNINNIKRIKVILEKKKGVRK